MFSIPPCRMEWAQEQGSHLQSWTGSQQVTSAGDPPVPLPLRLRSAERVCSSSTGETNQPSNFQSPSPDWCTHLELLLSSP